MILPYWNTDLDLEVAPWFPLGLDYHPVSIYNFGNPQIRRIASRCLAFDSEFLFMSSIRSGCVGSLMRDNFYKDEPNGLPLLGFVMILSYSPDMERLIVDTLTNSAPDFESESEHDDNVPEILRGNVSAGVAFCSLWTRANASRKFQGMASESENDDEDGAKTHRAGRHILMGSFKVIALVNESIFFDETEFLNNFEAKLDAGLSDNTGAKSALGSKKSKDSRAALPFFAEKFGYRRFSMPYDMDDPMQLRISQLLYEIEFAETRQMVGPSPEVPFPPLIVMR